MTLLWGTIKLRPYVFVFLFFYLIAGYRLLGGRRLALFTSICWLLAFLSEYSSTRCGFPYGWYHYTGSTIGEELFISNVPFMDSLSYTFLQFSGFSTALFFLFPRNGRTLKLPERLESSKPWRLSFLSAVLVTYLDIIIDPLAHQGSEWFLGKIYYYPYPGAYFEVPLSNFLGWLLVSFLSVRAYLWLENKLPERDADLRQFEYPIVSWLGDGLGVLLYAGVIVFNLAVTYWIGDMQLFFAGVYISLLPTILWILHLQKTAKS